MVHFYRYKPSKILSLKDLNFVDEPFTFPRRTPDEDIIKNYHKTRDFPAIQGTTRLGIHLRFGTISIRQLVKTARQLNDVFLNELIWREFFMMILYHHPRVMSEPFNTAYQDISWINNDEHFQLWCEGKTGYPLVDAGMRELNESGYMHNRVRMVTAGFLVKDLLIDWRWGEQYFAEKLLDFELSSNNGNWQWSAGCGCDAAPYFRIFNPESQAKKFDQDQRYIKNRLPEFGSPDYPDKIIDHKIARERTLQVFRESIKR
jgi:deoxyribodipyrimidine photo-lyase